MFPEFSPESKVWIYTADRFLDETDQGLIAQAMALFLPQWAAHGDSLFGDFVIVEDRMLVLAVDESKISASGCSIDTSVRFIKELGEKINVDFFNRMNMIVDDNGDIKSVHVADLKNTPDAIVYNSMISNLHDLRNNWRVKVSESPFV